MYSRGQYCQTQIWIFGFVRQSTHHCVNICWVCMLVYVCLLSDCGECYSYSTQIVWANSSLISAHQSLDAKGFMCFPQAGGERSEDTWQTHASGARSSSSLETLMSSSNGSQVSQTLRLQPYKKKSVIIAKSKKYPLLTCKTDLGLGKKNHWHLDVWMFI